MTPRLIYYAGQYLEAVALGILLLALLVLAVRWLNRRYAPPDMPDDDGERM